MNVKYPDRINTHTIASKIAKDMDLPYIEVYEILKAEHDFTRKMIVESDTSISYDCLITFVPDKTPRGYKTYKIKLARYILKDLLEERKKMDI